MAKRMLALTYKILSGAAVKATKLIVWLARLALRLVTVLTLLNLADRFVLDSIGFFDLKFIGRCNGASALVTYIIVHGFEQILPSVSVNDEHDIMT